MKLLLGATAILLKISLGSKVDRVQLTAKITPVVSEQKYSDLIDRASS